MQDNDKIVEELKKFEQTLNKTRLECLNRAKFFKSINCKREVKHWGMQMYILINFEMEIKSILSGSDHYDSFGEDNFLKE